MFSHKIIRVKWIFLVFLPKMGVHKKAFTPFWLKPWPRETFCGRDIYTSTTEIPYQKPKICLESGQHLRLVDGVVAKVKCKDNEFMTKKSIFLEYITPINSKEIYIWNPMTTRSIMQSLSYFISLVFLSLTRRDIWGLTRDGFICWLTDTWFNLTSGVITKLNTSITFMFSPGHIISSNTGFPPPLLAHTNFCVFLPLECLWHRQNFCLSG